MEKLRANGFLIQELENSNYIARRFFYLGINAFHHYPLSNVNDNQCREITEKQQIKKCEDGYQILEFISDESLLEQYILCCNERKINIRILFVESDYPCEIWKGRSFDTEFLGYEYCPMPIDEQIISDLDLCPYFENFRSILNNYGLFNTYNEALNFKRAYESALKQGIVGDGEADAYICKVFQCKIE